MDTAIMILANVVKVTVPAIVKGVIFISKPVSFVIEPLWDLYTSSKIIEESKTFVVPQRPIEDLENTEDIF